MDKATLKQDAIELLEKVDSEHALFIIYGTIKAVCAEQEAIKQGVVDDWR